MQINEMRLVFILTSKANS